MIDNYDSFTFNLVQYLAELGAEVNVIKNDNVDYCEKSGELISHLIVSPGPRTPAEAGISIPLIKNYSGKVPILGVCLGHQCIAQIFGGTIVRGRDIMHGKTSMIFHNNRGIFKGLNNPFTAMRYHSLVLSKEDLPNSLEITAWTQNSKGELDEIMGVRHKNMAIDGVQFHPESILSEHGHLLLNNFLENKTATRY